MGVGGCFTWAMYSSACESMVLMTGLNALMQAQQCSISSENFILFKYNNFQIGRLIIKICK